MLLSVFCFLLSSLTRHPSSLSSIIPEAFLDNSWWRWNQVSVWTVSYLRTQSSWEEHQAGQERAGVSQLYLQQVRGLSLTTAATTLKTVTSRNSSILIFIIPAHKKA